MSRFENVPILLLDGVSLSLDGKVFVISGKKGKLSFNIPNEVELIQEEKSFKFKLKKAKDNKSKSLIGLSYRMANNMIKGVSEGFTKKLEFNGVGYRIAVKGQVLNMQLGYSHDINYNIPQEVEIEVNKNLIIVKGIDKELVGRVADKIKSFRPIEPYKGKGIKYTNQYVIRKVGKAAK